MDCGPEGGSCASSLYFGISEGEISFPKTGLNQGKTAIIYEPIAALFAEVAFRSFCHTFCTPFLKGLRSVHLLIA
jgi:hypothetical protein